MVRAEALEDFSGRLAYMGVDVGKPSHRACAPAAPCRGVSAHASVRMRKEFSFIHRAS